MLRILRAFAWMRWRVLINSLERTAARDTIERLSLAADQLAPIIAILLVAPTMIAAAGLSAFAGYVAATRPVPPVAFEVLRYALLGASALALIGPLLMPGAAASSTARLRLLPIPRATLYLAHAGGALVEPWILVLLPVMLGVPGGLAFGQAMPAAAVSLVAGALLLLILIGLTTLTAGISQLVVRDRGRGELVALGMMLALPLVWTLVASPAPERAGVRWTATMAHAAMVIMPSELYALATRAALDHVPAASSAALAGLLVSVVLVHAAGATAFGRVLSGPGSEQRGHTSARRSLGLRIPGLSPAAEVVALAHVRLALRTPRGRSTLLTPLLTFVALAVMSTRTGGGRSLLPSSGIGLAVLGGTLSLLSILPLAMNQLAIDGAGLTLQLLAPLSAKDLLTGKAIANGLIAAGPVLVVVLATALLFPGGPLALWISVPLGIAATYLLAAPAAAFGSILFPRAVNLNSIGNASNAHGVAGLLGLFSFMAAGLPPLGLATLATWLHRPWLAPLFLTVWTLIAWRLAAWLFVPLQTLLVRRRENLGLVAG